MNSKCIKFNFNLEKAIEVILWLSKQKVGMKYHTLLKLLFYAEEYHLNKYFRPIVGDSYVAMAYGPVASTMYDLLKKEELVIEYFDGELPFDNSNKKITPLREPNLSKLSKSDVEALEYSWNEFKNYDFTSFVDKTHQHPAWLKARVNCFSNNPLMNYADFFKEENKHFIEDLEDIAEFICI